MDKKRQAVSDPDAAANLPPTKLYRPSEDPPAPAPSHHQPPPQAASSKPPDPSSLPDSFHPSESETILTFQRAQLAAKITEQERDLVWLRDKVEELRKLVAVLDAAPRAALYHMCAVREDLTFTLARIGLSRDIDLAESPIAAVMLNAEVVTNESLAEMPAAIKKLTAQIVLAIEAREQNPNPDLTIKKANEELHRRLREVSDQLERYAERDKQSLVSSTTFRDEYDDLREESSLQRRKIVALELKLKEKQKNAIAKQEELRNGDGLTASADLESSVKEPANPAGHSVSPQNEDKVAVDIAKALAEKRLEELKESHEENVRLTTELETMRVEIAKRDSNIVPIKTILDTGMYRTMEANLQQLYLKEKNWQMERDSLNEDRETERKDAQEQLVEANAAFEKSTGDLRRQMEELRRIADCAKVEKDKVGMKSEAKKIDAGDAASIIAAADIRAKVSEEMRDKLSRANVVLSKEIKTLQSQLKDAENQLKEKGPVSFIFFIFFLMRLFHALVLCFREQTLIVGRYISTLMHYAGP